MKRNLLLLLICILVQVGLYAQTSCTDLNGYVKYKDTGISGYYTLNAGYEEKAAQTYYYSGPGKVSSVRIYGHGPAGIEGGVPLTVSVYNVDNTRRPTSVIQSAQTTWWWRNNNVGYLDVFFPEGGVAVNGNFAIEVGLRNAFPFGSSFQLRYTGDGEGRGQDLASLAGTSTGGNWTSATTNFNHNGDFYLVPGMTNYITSGFTVNTKCIATGGTINFTNTTQMCKDSMFNLIGWHAAPGFHYYEWNFGDGSAISNAVSPTHVFNTPGVYTVSLKGNIVGWNDTCYDIKTMQISVGLQTGTTSIVNVSCNGSADGSVVGTVGGGDPNYVFGLGGEVYYPSPDFTGLAAGNYTMHVIDGIGCMATAAFTITQPSAISFVSTMVTNASCGTANGGILVTAAGGSGALQYKLNEGVYQATGAFSNIGGGSYVVTVKDANGCITSEMVAVNDAGGPGLNLLSVSEVSCYNANDGSIIVAGSGGSGNLQYSINGGGFQSTGVFNGLAAGNYGIMVKDAVGCTQSTEVSIMQPEQLFLSAASSPVSCNGGNNGTIDITSASGGTGIFSYSINGTNYQSNTTFSGLTSGPYTVHVKDAAGCTNSVDVSVKQPTPVSATITATNATCFDGGDGILNVAASGGTPGYTFSMDGEYFQPVGNFSNLAAGNYTITVMDANQCTITKHGIVNQPSQITASINTTLATCGNSNGGLVAIAAGGSGSGYIYGISSINYNSNGSFTNLSSGTYYLIIADGSLCGNTFVVNIADANGPVITSTSHTNVSCNGGDDGTITINNVSGGTGNLSYSLNGINWQYTNKFNFIHAGDYVVTVKDANGCTGTAFDTLTEPNPFSMNTTVTDLACYNDYSGQVSVIASGGAGVLAYSIDGGSTYQASNVFTDLSAGGNFLFVRDAAGCIGVVEYDITQTAKLEMTSSVLNVTCNGAQNGAIILNAWGGTGSYTYSLNSESFYASSLFLTLSGGVYTVAVKDGNGCVTSIQVPVYEPAPLVTTPVINNVSCSGGDNGTIALEVTGGTGPYLYQWADRSTRQDRFNLMAGTYSVTVKDYEGCGDTSVFEVTQPAAPLVVNGVVVNSTNAGSHDGSVGLTVTGGDGPYTFVWSNNQTTQDISGLAPGNYSVNVKDANGCVVTGIFYVTNATGIAQVETVANSLSIYPNPSANTAMIEVKGGEIARLKVMNLLGQVVFESQPKQAKVEFQCGNFASGVYIVEVEVNGALISKRLTVSR